MEKSIKQRIIDFNLQFGLKTEFITDKDILGYALGETIYINESIEQDYERTNKHELLHFFEETEEFKRIKERLFKEHREELDEIRKEYKLRYYGIYTAKEIEEGVLDDEIAIDMMVDNSSIEYKDGLKLGEEFLGEIKRKLEEKRYLNLALNANLKNMNLSDWEKIFVLNYYDRKEKELPQGKNKIEKIREDIEKYLEELYEIEASEMQIDPHSKEVIREYESEIKALKARGEDTSLLELNRENSYQEIAKKISEQLYAEYKHIVDLIKGLEYEPAFKSMMLRETLTKVYKLDINKETEEKKTIVKNRNLKESISGHMILNESTLETIYKNIENSTEYKNFANLYFAAVEVYKRSITKESGITLEGVETFDKGKWLKFDGKQRDEEHYLENAKKLSALVQDTPWCTKTLAATQLAEGDFYVFIDNEGKPHIAVKTSGDEIDEVRGIQNGNGQELEEEYRDVAISFLDNNRNIKNGKEWLEKEEWNKRLIEYKRKIENNEFTIEDVPGLIEDYFKNDYRNHGLENTNKRELLKSLDKVKDILGQYYKCKEEEIYIGDIVFKDTDLIKNPYKVIFGNADFSNSNIKDSSQLRIIGGYANFKDSQVTDLSQLQIIGGYANFKDSQVTDLSQLKSIGGYADFENSKVTDLSQLQSIGGYAIFRRSQVTDLSQLQIIGGAADFRNSQVTDLSQLERIGGEAYFDNSQVTNLSKLKNIGGNANFSNSQVTDLSQLKSIGGYAIFKRSQVTDLSQLQIIGGAADFNNSQVTDLSQLKSIGRSAWFKNSKVTDLSQLQSIGGDASFRNSQVTDLSQLQSIGGSADFENSKVTDLSQLKSIGRHAYFANSQVTDLSQLQSIGGDAYFANSQVTDLSQLERIGGNADFNNSQVTDLSQLKSIGGDANFRDSQVTDLSQLERIGGDASFRNSQVTDLSQLQSIGGDADFRDSQVTDLSQLKSIGGYADFSNSQVTDLSQLEKIGGSANFENSKVTDLSQLKSIGRNASFRNSQVTDLSQLQSIGEDADFENSKVTDLSQLQSIGGYADFRNSQVTDISQLQRIEGHAYFRKSKVMHLSQLKSIGGCADFRNSQVTNLSNLKNIGGKFLGNLRLNKVRETITGHDIFKAGVGTTVEESDKAGGFLKKIKELINKYIL